MGLRNKTMEGFERDIYPNKLVPFSEDAQIFIARGIGGRLPCDWIPRPQQKKKSRRPISAKKKLKK